MKNSSISTILLAIGIICLAFAGIRTNIQLSKIDKKIDNVASETDATAERLDNLESDFKEYRTGTKEIIDSICEQLKIHKEDMQNEIERIDDDVENVRISKANKHKAYATASTATYYQPTDGLTKQAGVNYYGEQKETYYNLNMSRVVSNAQGNGLDGEYWVRDDGVKMYGDYVIVAANQEVHPYGSTVETSMGTGIVLDTGGYCHRLVRCDMEELNVEEIVKAGKMLMDFLKKMCQEIAEVIKNAIDTISDMLQKEKTKHRFVKSLIKPYKQPFIKIRHRARTNC